MEQKIVEKFFQALFKEDKRSVYTDRIPKEMIDTPPDKSGWFTWKPLKGNLKLEDYRKLETEFNNELPRSELTGYRNALILKQA